MHALHSTGISYEKSGYFTNITYRKMDYRQKMVIPTPQKYKSEDDDDEDLEALRLAALKSLRAKPATNAKSAQITSQGVAQTGSSQFPPYSQRFGKREFFHSNRPPRQNGNVYHPSRNNQNLIEIIPVEENAESTESENKASSTTDPLSTFDATEASKFQRYNDASGSDEEESKDPKSSAKTELTPEKKQTHEDEAGTDKENQSAENSPRVDEENDLMEEGEEQEEEEEGEDEDDDDILLMADLEEEDSLERLMDEMEREMNVEKSPTDKKDKKSSKKERESKKVRNKNRIIEKLESSSTALTRNDSRPVSPYGGGRVANQNRSLSPKQKSRKKSPRRSPPRQLKKQREPPRLRSPRKSPPRYSPHPRSPRSRSPRLSPRRSPNRSPVRRLSPRGRSPHSRSPLRLRRSRSPRILSRSRSPRFISRTRSPPRGSPARSPLPRSPKVSPHRLSPVRRASPRRSRSPRSPRRSPRRSPKLSPRRPSPRRVSPRTSPKRSPWSSPRNSPRLSPRRRRSPPKDRKRRSLTPEDTVSYKKETSPVRRNVSPDGSRTKVKPVGKDTAEVSNDPVLEARRRKFESTRPIDPTANKKIKLSKKDDKKSETLESVQVSSPKRKTREMIEEYEVIPDEELSLHEDYNFDDLEEVLSDGESQVPEMCVEVAPMKIEKERVKKKKKKDKEIYQIGKMKDTPLSERIPKEKKCKKRKDVTPEVIKEEVETAVEEQIDEEADLRTELSRRRAERLNRTVPIQSARLLQSAFKGVVTEAAKNNAKVIQRHLVKTDDKSGQKEIRRVTVLHRTVQDLPDSEETIDSKVPVRFRLGINKQTQETHEKKTSRKSSKRQGRKVKHKNNLSVSDIDRQK